MHIFIVPIRDPKTLLLLPGVLVGDMGPKAGLNGLDNGFATFFNVRIPRENLLNRTGDVTADGKYVTPFKDASKRFGVSLGALSNGRVGLTHYGPCFMGQALTIAVRYAAVRKQFGPGNGREELPIIEYQSHQYRLMPALAICYAWRNFSTSFFLNLGEFLFGLFTKDRSERIGELGKEIHVLSCASKPVSSWTAQQIIQECREACGGHGYLKASRLGDLRNNNDPLLTFEGDNNVLIQQTSNSLIAAFEDFLKTKKVPETPLQTLKFLENYELSMGAKFSAASTRDLLNPMKIMQMFDWLLCFVLTKSYERYEKNIKCGKDSFTARNENQVFYANTLSIVFIERQVIERLVKRLSENTDLSLKPALDRILFLSALYFLDKHMVLFYQGGYFVGEQPAVLIRETILELCREMKNDSIALIDAIAPPDYVLNSILGDSNGNVYQNIYNSMLQSNGAFDRIGCLDEYLNKTKFGCLKSKL